MPGVFPAHSIALTLGWKISAKILLCQARLSSAIDEVDLQLKNLADSLHLLRHLHHCGLIILISVFEQEGCDLVFDLLLSVNLVDHSIQNWRMRLRRLTHSTSRAYCLGTNSSILGSIVSVER